MYGGSVFGLTMPLVTKADGTKFGKTESGTIWLDANKTSPYAFYQFWLNTADADVYKFLRYFTFLSVEDIAAIEAEDAAAEGRPQAQGVLAREMTAMIHGEDGLAAAQRITDALFSGELNDLSASDLAQIKLDGLPSSDIVPADLSDVPLTTLLAEHGMASSGKQVKDALQRNSVFVNGVAYGMEANLQVAEIFSAANAMHDKFFVVRLGKKKYHLFEI
jgi:tyrosyl-tRNA synthetase